MRDLEALEDDVVASLERVGKAGDEERGAALRRRLDALRGELIAATRELGSFIGAQVAVRRFRSLGRARGAAMRGAELAGNMAKQLAAGTALRLLGLIATLEAAASTTPGDLEALELGRARVDELLALDGVRTIVEARRTA